jgi:hypothetical protein
VCAPNYVWTRNVMIGAPTGPDPNGQSLANFPAGNWNPATINDVGFVDPSSNNYRLRSDSPYRNAASDGKDVGVDMDQLLAHLSGPIPTSTPTPAPAPTSVPTSFVWERVSGAPDQLTSIAFVGNDLYVTSFVNNSVYVSHDSGATWSTVNDGLPVITTGLGNLVVSANGTLTVSVWESSDYRLVGTTWQQIPNSVASYFSDRTLDQNGNLVHVTQTQTNQVARSADDGMTLQTIGSYSSSGYGSHVPYGVSKAPDGTLYVGTEHDGVHYSTDDGVTWSWLGVYEVYPGQVYPFGNAHVIKVNAGGQPVVGSGQGGIFVHVGSIAPRSYPADVENANTVNPTWMYATGYPSTYLGSDNSVHDFTLLSNGDMLVHGGRIYRSTDGGRSWSLDDAGIPAGRINTPYAQGVPSFLHHTMAQGPDGRIYVAIPAPGYGIYRTTTTTPTSTPAPASLAVSITDDRCAMRNQIDFRIVRFGAANYGASLASNKRSIIRLRLRPSIK